MALSRPRLLEARANAGITQRELAEALGVTRPMVARWEKGEQEPRVKIAIRLARELGTTVEAIWMPESSATGGTEKSGAAPRQRPTP